MSKVIVIGGGAAGMMAALFAARNGHEVHLYEKNEKLGKKIFITGKGRCNVTNACEIEELLDHVVTNKEFLYSGFYSFTNDAMMELLEELGCPLKVERGNRVFPVSIILLMLLQHYKEVSKKKMLTYISIQLSKRF